MELFRQESLMEIHLPHSESAPIEEVKASVSRLFLERHDTDDVTIATQEQMLGVLDSILKVLPQAVAGLGHRISASTELEITHRLMSQIRWHGPRNSHTSTQFQYKCPTELTTDNP